MAGFAAILLILQWLLLSQPSYSLPLCTDFRAPTKIKTPLGFCPYDGTTCCDSTKDLQLQKQFQRMNISDTTCASLVKSILCATCDPFAAEIFKAKAGNQQQKVQPIPGLCNSTDSGASHSSKQSTSSFCSTVWNTCKDISISNSPFAPSLQGGAPISSNLSTLADLWQSEDTFCDVFGSPSGNDSVCFAGESIKLNNDSSETDVPAKGLCLEKIGTGSYISMAPHPDGSNRAFFSNLPGKIWLGTIPEQDSGEKLDLDESDPFVDLTDQVLFDTIFGMLGIAFHPDFARNGRFFASYNCDRIKSPECVGRCACNSDVDCDPSKFNSSGSSTPCQYQSVIAEYTANGTASDPSVMQSGQPTEVRRIFTMGLPSSNNHGGQILFGPEDGYLYVMMGDGGGRDDPYKFSQNKKSILGKILRLDVDTIPSEKEIGLGLWGNYSVPRDNPYSEDKELAPEIWAMGFRNPWRCSFDAERPSYFVCGDVGQDQYEEIDVVTKGGNYGWNIYEGIIPSSTGNDTNTSSLATQNLILPVAGYTHSAINKKTGSAAISGGFFYRSETDPCMSGRYLYGDLYASNIWAATENPRNSGNFSTAAMPFSCGQESPLECGSAPGTTLPALGYIYSFGQDNRKDVLILASSGVYRVVRPSRCNYTCSKEIVRPATGPSPTQSSPSSGAQSIASLRKWLYLFLSFFILKCL
ncbi:hypothetical protein BVRB_6g154950 [Beta vulgaris subsp. vulgaris]|nr:hypothetical protein BVRB_6g154950 [Beta vulgaris subsp. vulgaris]